MSGVCSHCGCAEIDIDQTRGDAVCTACGSVLEDQRIVSEVQFQEMGSGAASVVGQFVGSDGHKEPSLGSSFQHGYGKESKAETLLKAKRRIQNLGAILKLNQHCIDTAMNFFKMAYLKRLTRTRKSAHVIAACVYLVCRTEGLPHMLLDISDALQVNVYTLGKTYLILSRHLCINIPAIDPCLYIPRFAHRLEFGDKTHEVSMTALRLVQRMKRDWMGTGRRPAGLCGSALLVAARLHEFSRSVKDIIKVVKVCQSTIKKRLNEFEATASSNLTIDEFQRIDLETEHDPPAYIEGKKKSKVHPVDDTNKLSEYTTEVDMYQEQIEKSLAATYKYPVPSIEDDRPSEPPDPPPELSTTPTATPGPTATPSTTPTTPTLNPNTDSTIASLETEEMSHIIGQSQTGPRPSAASLGIEESIQECLREDTTEDKDDIELDLTGIDDAELDKFILSEEEVRVKTAMWMAENQDYLKQVEEKAEREAKEAEENPKKVKKRPARKSKPQIQAKTVNEAIEQMLQQKRISNKINYDVLKDLNKDTKPTSTAEVTPSTSTAAEATPKTQSDTVFSRFKKPSAQPSTLLSPKAKSESRSLKRPNVVKTEPSTKRTKTEVEPEPSEAPAVAAFLIESGPVEYAAHDQDEELEEDMEEDEEDGLVAATQLFGNADYEEEYYDNDNMDDMD